MSLYVQGTGLVDIDATTVRCSELTADAVGAESGVLDMRFSQLANVGNINSVNIQSLSNVSYATSNYVIPKAEATSNALVGTSNLVLPMAAFGSNLAVWDSNAITGLSNAFLGLSNAIVPQATFGSNVATATSNSYFATVNTSAGALSNLRPMLATSNLNFTGVLRVAGSNIVDVDRKIDYSWLKNVPTFSNAPDNTLAVTGITLGAAGILSGLGGQLIGQNGALGASVLDDIGKKLGEQAIDESFDPTTDSSNISVHWNSILYVPVHKNRGDSRIGFSSNVFLSSNGCRVWSCPSSDMTLVDGGRYRRMNFPLSSSNLLIDPGARQFFGNDFFAASNVNSLFGTFTSNVSSSVQSTIVTSSNLTATGGVNVGSFWVLPSGVWLGNPATNPLGAVQVIDSSGNYLGAVRKDQLTGGEALDYARLGDGVLSLANASTAAAPVFTDPFVLSPFALFNL